MNRALELSKKYKTLLNKNGINTPNRLACFFGQCMAEVGESLEPKQESGYYSSIKALRNTFKTPFKNKSDVFVSKFVKLPKNEQYKLFDYVYANRMGNGDEKSGDGSKYSGKGIKQLTGYDNYKMASDDTGVNYVKYPELLLTEADSLIVAIWYWNKNKLNKYADILDIDTISDIINIGKKTNAYGDANGFDNRKYYTKKLLELFSN